ncbi:hypothetical protein AAHA92_21957 [Salvia divinorum]|uniref:Uncharacterized protein n=1 Tax=Salvia divinorum TaxID=28513 RepID=A0ABD1GM44_SALDI
MSANLLRTPIRARRPPTAHAESSSPTRSGAVPHIASRRLSLQRSRLAPAVTSSPLSLSSCCSAAPKLARHRPATTSNCSFLLPCCHPNEHITLLSPASDLRGREISLALERSSQRKF